MLRFKAFIVEHLTDYQQKKFKNMPIEPGAKAHLDRHFGKDVEEVHEPIDMGDSNKSEVHKEVEKHIDRPLTKQEYAAGKIKDPKYPTREIKLGKLIKDSSIRDKFNADTTRTKSTNDGEYSMRIVRGTHVAGQTNQEPTKEQPNGHSWANDSCKNIDDGMFRDVIPKEIKHGTVVCFAKNKHGEEIYRATLQPHHAVGTGDAHTGKNTIYKLNSEYGLRDPAFTKHAEGVAHNISDHPADKSTLYKINSNVYNDNKPHFTMHSEASHDDVRKAYNKLSDDYSDKIKKRDILDNNNAPKDVVDHHIFSKSKFKLEDVPNQPIDQNHISHILKSDASLGVVDVLSQHKQFNKGHLDLIANHPKTELRTTYYDAAHNSIKSNEEKDRLFDKFEDVNRHTTNVRLAGRILDETKNPDVIRDLNKHNDEYLHYSTIYNTHSPSDVVNKIINTSKDEYVTKAGFSHPNLSDPKLLDQATKSGNPKKHAALLRNNKHLTTNHIDNMLNNQKHYVPYHNDHETINKMIANHPVATENQQSIAMKKATNVR